MKIAANLVRPLRCAIAITVATTALSACIPALIAGGIGAAAYVATDRRTSDTLLADERIERTINVRTKNELKDSARVNVNVFNRVALISGEAKTPEVKAEAERIASLVEGVRGVHNEVEVTGFRTPREQMGDASITTQVKARMVGNGVFNPLHVQASTDGGVVFLQGQVTQTEAEAAARIAAGTSGVKKVVRLFEIIPESAIKN